MSVSDAMPRYQKEPAHLPPEQHEHNLEKRLGPYRELTVERHAKAPLSHEAAPTDGEGPYDWAAGRRYMTRAGIRVRSKAEKIIADFLTSSGIRFLYEPIMDVSGRTFRPDFYLLDYNLAYEHFGLETQPYLRRAEEKMASYRRAGVPFIYTTARDEFDLEDVIVDQLAAASLGDSTG
jgi:hypothetical protein